MRILISGASIAGPVLAYWLTRRGCDVTVVERASALRKTGGHAIDLFRPAMEISERMGVLPQILSHATGTERFVVSRAGSRRTTTVDYLKLLGVVSDRHVEIMRDDLSQIYYDATRDDVEYLFGNEITAIDDGEVTFSHGAPRSYDVIVGADGLHSGVRHLVFGPDAGQSRFLGSYLSVLSVPKALAHEGEMTCVMGAGRLAMIYTADHLDDARAAFVFKPQGAPLHYDHSDDAGHRAMLRSTFSGLAPMVDDWLAELDSEGSFYFDSITQLELTTWSRGRVALVGDAGYCPGPAVGGSTSLAVLGAYALAGELGRAGGDYASAFAAYEGVMADPVRRSRAFARTTAKTLIPSSDLGVRAIIAGAQAIALLPAGLTHAVAKLNANGVRLYDTMRAPDYPLPVG